MVDAARIAAAAETLAAARRAGRVIDGFPPEAAPRDLAEAIAVQDLLAKSAGARTLGWKIGATAREVQAKIGLAHPFFGRILAGTVHADGAALPAGGGHNILEAEFAVRLARAPERGDTAETIAGCVEAVHLSIEINRPSFRSPFAMRGLDVIADNGSNAGLVLGAPVADWRQRDLAAEAVIFRLNGQERARGAGAAVMGHPFAALAWLANERARLGAPLAAGDLVATGSLMGFVAAKAGETAEAEFPSIGTVVVRLA